MIFFDPYFKGKKMVVIFTTGTNVKIDKNVKIGKAPVLVHIYTLCDEYKPNLPWTTIIHLYVRERFVSDTRLIICSDLIQVIVYPEYGGIKGSNKHINTKACDKAKLNTHIIDILRENAEPMRVARYSFLEYKIHSKILDNHFSSKNMSIKI